MQRSLLRFLVLSLMLSACGSHKAHWQPTQALGTTHNLPIHGRLFLLDEAQETQALTPLQELKRETIAEAIVEVVLLDGEKRHHLGHLQTNGEGVIETSLSLKALSISPGQHPVQISYQGKECGAYEVLLLAPGHSRPVLRSDMDMTYLLTDFHSAAAVLELLGQEAAEKQALPGMTPLMQSLTQNGLPLTFISGSPLFFNDVLSSKLRADELPFWGLSLKPIGAIARYALTQAQSHGLLPELKEQIGYKLALLLSLRSAIPDSTPELLFGDDSEADFVVYALYARAISGQMSETELATALHQLEVSAYWQEEVLQHFKPLKDRDLAPVIAIFINLTDTPSAHYELEDWHTPITYGHRGSWPLAIGLSGLHYLDEDQVDAIYEALLASGLSEQELASHAQDFLELNFSQ